MAKDRNTASPPALPRREGAGGRKGFYAIIDMIAVAS